MLSFFGLSLNLAASCVPPSVKGFDLSLSVCFFFMFADTCSVSVNLSFHTRSCPLAAVDGGWDEWSEWTVCSSQCEKQRSRGCNSPAPRHRGKMCEGNSEATENCTDGMCTQSKAFHPAGYHHHHHSHHFPIIHHHHIYTQTQQVITSMFELEVYVGREGGEKNHAVDWHRCLLHDNVGTLSPVCCSLDILYVTLNLSQGKKCSYSLLDWCLTFGMKCHCTVWVMHMQWLKHLNAPMTSVITM